MREKIVEALESEAERRDSRILFAVESGSRAWGFASPDSDYGVRAVYVRRLDWYLGLEEAKADTWGGLCFRGILILWLGIFGRCFISF